MLGAVLKTCGLALNAKGRWIEKDLKDHVSTSEVSGKQPYSATRKSVRHEVLSYKYTAAALWQTKLPFWTPFRHRSSPAGPASAQEDVQYRAGLWIPITRARLSLH